MTTPTPLAESELARAYAALDTARHAALCNAEKKGTTMTTLTTPITSAEAELERVYAALDTARHVALCNAEKLGDTPLSGALRAFAQKLEDIRRGN